MADMNEYKHTIREFLSKYIQDKTFRDEDDLFKNGYVSSLMAIELVMFVEGEFGISIGNEDLNLDNFKSVSAIAELAERKMTA